jgi:hypothetical protein
MAILPDDDHGDSYHRGVYTVERSKLDTGENPATGQKVTWLTGWTVWNNEIGKRETLDWPFQSTSELPLTVVYVKR